MGSLEQAAKIRVLLVIPIRSSSQSSNNTTNRATHTASGSRSQPAAGPTGQKVDSKTTVRLAAARTTPPLRSAPPPMSLAYPTLFSACAPPSRASTRKGLALTVAELAGRAPAGAETPHTHACKRLRQRQRQQQQQRRLGSDLGGHTGHPGRCRKSSLSSSAVENWS